MKYRRDYLDFLRDIVETMDKAESFVAGMSYEEFRNSEKTRFAIVHALEVIGEATKNLPIAVRRRYPEVPWKKMAGMRDKVIHNYFGIDWSIVWETVTGLIPTLKGTVTVILKQETEQMKEKKE